MGKLISDSTASKLKTLLSHAQVPSAKAGNAGKGGVRLVSFVKVNGDKDSDGYYPGKAQSWKADDESWNEYDSDCLVFDCTDGTLASDTKYLGIRFGNKDTKPVFVVTGSVALCYVKVTDGPDSDTELYPCQEQTYNGSDWQDVGDAGKCKEPNGKPLHKDWRYMAVRVSQGEDPTGESGSSGDSDTPMYTTQALIPLGCGLEYTEDDDGHDGDKTGKLQLKLDDVAGDGLDVDDGDDGEGESDQCKKLKVKEGCHISVAAGGVSVDTSSLAGKGLKEGDAGSNGCKKLDIANGCGLRFDQDGKLSLDAEGVCYEAIKGVNGDGANGCSISLRYGCHLTLVPDQHEDGEEAVDVDLDTLAGKGLKVGEEGQCPKLELKDPGCGLRWDGNGKLALDAAGVCYEAIKGVNDDGNGCSISLRYGCHLTLVPDQHDEGEEAVDVSVSTLAGCGLKVETPEGANPCDKLAVDVAALAGAGLEVEEDEAGGCARLKVTGVAPDYTCLEVVTDVSCDPDTKELVVQKKWIRFVGTVSDDQPEECD